MRLAFGPAVPFNFPYFLYSKSILGQWLIGTGGISRIGRLPEDVLMAVLETLPMEFSVVDADDKVLAWNRHETRIFKRPEGVVGKDVHNCHPKKSLDKVEQILREMKDGKRNMASFWIDIPNGPEKQMQKILIQYFALRDKNGKYLGCLEASQNISEHQAMSGQKRLLD